MVAAKIISSILIIIVAIFICLCGWSWIAIPDKLEIIQVTVFGMHFQFREFRPIQVLMDLIEEGPMLFDGIWREGLVCMAVGALFWLLAQIIVSRIIRLFANPDTTLHGSAKWATKRELRAAGLLQGTGLVMGQTYDAVYAERHAKRPRRRKGESRSEFRDRLSRYDRHEMQTVFEKPGELITQSKNAHTLIVGSTRSGKGVSVIIPTEFKWEESMIIFDPKAEGWEIAGNFRSRFSWCFKFEPEKPDESIHYNPLLSIRRGKQTIPDIQNLAYILIPLNENAKDPFWDNEARRLFAAVIGYVIYCEPPEKKTFAQVYSVFSDYEQLESEKLAEGNAEDDDDGLLEVKKYLRMYQNKLDEYMQKGKPPAKLYDEYVKAEAEHAKALTEMERAKQETGEAPRSLVEKERKTKKALKRLQERMKPYLGDDDIQNLKQIRKDVSYFANCEDKQLSSVLSTMTSQLQVIADPNVQAITDRSDFVMEDFVMGVKDSRGMNHPLTLYMVSSASSLSRLQPLFKLFYEQAITLLTREMDSKRPYRLLLMFDEFRQLGRMDIVEKALALTAGYGVLCCIAIQTFAQLRVLYQDDAMFIDNFAYQIILRVNDEATCQKIERILGQSTEKHTSMSFSGNMGQIVHSGENIQTNIMGRSLMTAEEIRTMPENECLIISSGMHPYKGKKVRYYLDDRFTRHYIGRNGKKLPVPRIEDNYPHADKDGRSHGIDGEGWMLLKGVDEARAGSNDYIEGDGSNGRGAKKDEPSAEERMADGQDDYLDDESRRGVAAAKGNAGPGRGGREADDAPASHDDDARQEDAPSDMVFDF